MPVLQIVSIQYVSFGGSSTSSTWYSVLTSINLQLVGHFEVLLGTNDIVFLDGSNFES